MRDTSKPRLVRVANRDTWHIYHARRRFSTGCTDRAAAEVVLARFVAHPVDGPAIVSSATILARYLADRKDRAKPGAERLEWAHKPLTRILGHKPPEALSEAESRAYARQRAKEGVGSGTTRTELQALSAALRWAHGTGLIAAIPKLELPPRPPPRERWLTRAEAERLIASCRGEHVRLFVMIALHTAARAGSILALTWDRVDFASRRIDFREPGRARTRKGRSLVPINDTLLETLQTAHAGRVAEAVVEWAGGPVASVKHAFARAAARAALDDVTPHTLRHTAATWMVQAGVPIWEVAGMLGHSSPRMVEEVYGHHSSEFLKKAAGALG